MGESTQIENATITNRGGCVIYIVMSEKVYCNIIGL